MHEGRHFVFQLHAVWSNRVDFVISMLHLCILLMMQILCVTKICKLRIHGMSFKFKLAEIKLINSLRTGFKKTPVFKNLTQWVFCIILGFGLYCFLFFYLNKQLDSLFIDSAHQLSFSLDLPVL